MQKVIENATKFRNDSPTVLAIRQGKLLLTLSKTRPGKYTIRPLFRIFCRFVLYVKPYFVESRRINNVVTTLQLSQLLKDKNIIAVIPCVCRNGRTKCSNPCHTEHEPESCLSFDIAALIQIGSGLGKRLSVTEAQELCQRAASTGLAHHAIFS